MLVLLNHSNKLFGAPLKFAPGIRAFLPPPQYSSGCNSTFNHQRYFVIVCEH